MLKVIDTIENEDFLCIVVPYIKSGTMFSKKFWENVKSMSQSNQAEGEESREAAEEEVYPSKLPKSLVYKLLKQLLEGVKYSKICFL